MAHLGMALNESKRRKEMHDQVEALQQRLQTKGGKEIESLFKIGLYLFCFKFLMLLDRQFLNPPSAEVLKQIKVGAKEPIDLHFFLFRYVSDISILIFIATS